MTLNVPEELEREHDETARFLAAKLYEAGKLSLGQAASMASMSKRAFADILAGYAVSLLNYPVEDLKEEFARNAGI